MKLNLVVFVALVFVVVIALAIFEGARFYRASSQIQDGGASAQAQGAQNGGSSYH